MPGFLSWRAAPLEYLLRGIAAGDRPSPRRPDDSRRRTGINPSTGVRYCAAPGTGRTIKNLIESQIPMMPVAAADAEFLLHVGRRQHFGADDAAAQPGSEALQSIERASMKRCRPSSQPSLSAYGAYCTMADSTCWPAGAKRRVIDAGNRDLHDRRWRRIRRTSHGCRRARCARSEGAISSRPRSAASATRRGTAARDSSARCSLAASPRERIWLTRRTKPVSRCAAPSSLRKVVFGSALEITLRAPMRSPDSSSDAAGAIAFDENAWPPARRCE